MTPASAVAFLSAGIALYVALLARQLARAPGWQVLRHFVPVALSASGYALLNLPTSTSFFSDDVVVACSRVQLGMAALHAWAWVRYSGALAGGRRRIDRFYGPALLALSVLGAVTPALLDGTVRVHEVPPVGVYRTAATTLAGELTYGFVILGFVAALLRLWRAWRMGIPSAGVQLLALGVLLLLGANDALVAGGAYLAPYLGDVGLLLPAAAVGFSLTTRFVEEARVHERLRHGLEDQVAERTAELGRAQDALHRSEKLAALGQFAAGVAHEVNNPAAVVHANLAYLSEHEGEALSEEGHQALAESTQAVRRIAAIVRQLLDAGRLAASPESAGAVDLRRLGEDAMAVARARFGRRVRLTNVVPEGLRALGHEGVLAQVLANLVANGVQAIPAHRPDGRVSISAEERGARVFLRVEDDGAGMEPEVLRRVFEPFFTTKPFGVGTGLGLAVSRGLVISLGGDLSLESTPGVGTRASIELARAAPGTAPRARTPGERPAAPSGGRLLLVDDEAPVLASLRRQLEPRFGVEVAAGVEAGLARLEDEDFDLVLCDLMMPDGGGERLYRLLLDRDPRAARRVVFLTGGALTEEARRFLEEQPQPVLLKPLELDRLELVVDELRRLAGPLAH